MSSHLIPEQRTDKNGVTSTRWVKPDTGTGAAKRKLPAPEMPKQDTTPFLDAAFQTASVTGMTARDLDPRTSKAVEEAFAAVDASGSTMMMMEFRHVMLGALKQLRPENGGSHEQINNLGVFGATLLRNSSPKGRIHTYMNGMYRNGAFPYVDDFLLDATDEQREQAKALVHFANSAPEPWSKEYFGYNEFDEDDTPEAHEGITEDDHYVAVDGTDPVALTAFIIEHHEQVDEIIKIITERNSDDLTMIADLLGHEEAALKDGLL